jgi:2-polyprenyl-3-methyl-5-hydroxy-6-metoxy-1,4-benzoquinol methylase
MFKKFSERSSLTELLDEPDIPREQLFQNLSELDRINRKLGGHAVTLSGISKLVTDKNKTYHIVDIGCGGGDAMKAIAGWAKREGYKVKLTGVDMNKDCISFMNEACKEHSEISGVVADYRDYFKNDASVDIVHCSLFCHHLKDDELEELFHHLNANAKIGFVINDLHRHWLAYYGIMILTKLFNGSVLVRNDAPISVLRGFQKNELKAFLFRANVKNASLKWRWAFRYQIVSQKITENGNS